MKIVRFKFQMSERVDSDTVSEEGPSSRRRGKDASLKAIPASLVQFRAFDLAMKTTEELTNLTSSELLEHVHLYKTQAAEVGAEWAECEKRFKDLKEMMPSILSTILLHEKGDSFSERRALALSSEEYREKIHEMNRAEFERNLKEVEYRSLVKSLEALASIAYVRNSELKLAR